MKTIMKTVFGAVLLLHYMMSPASASDYQGKVAVVVCHTFTGLCQVTPSAPHTGPCSSSSSSGLKYIFDGSTNVGKNILAILLTAQATGLPAALGGLGTCSYGTEDLRHAYLYTP